MKRFSHRGFSSFSKLKERFSLVPPKDLNQQIRELDESKVKVTFGDIWQDYKNFRNSYYFRQFPTPKEIFEKAE